MKVTIKTNRIMRYIENVDGNQVPVYQADISVMINSRLINIGLITRKAIKKADIAWMDTTKFAYKIEKFAGKESTDLYKTYWQSENWK